MTTKIQEDRDDFMARKYGIIKYLEAQGFDNIDYTPDGHDIFRQKDDNPKMDIEIKFIHHTDNL